MALKLSRSLRFEFRALKAKSRMQWSFVRESALQGPEPSKLMTIAPW